MNLVTKQQVLEAAARGEGCLGKAAMEEPVFVIRGSDKLGPAAVASWASLVEDQLRTNPRTLRLEEVLRTIKLAMAANAKDVIWYSSTTTLVDYIDAVLAEGVSTKPTNLVKTRDKIDGARGIAARMREWQAHNGAKIPD